MKGDGDYVGSPRVGYAGGAVCVRTCPVCGRFVKADDQVLVNDWGLKAAANATCAVHGRVQMPFEGFMGEETDS